MQLLPGPVRRLNGSKEDQVLQDGEVVKQHVPLRTHPELPPDGRQVCLQALAVDGDGAGSGRVEPRQHGSAGENKSAEDPGARGPEGCGATIPGPALDTVIYEPGGAQRTLAA